MDGQPPDAPPQRYGILRRVLLVLVGGAAAFTGTAVVVLLAVLYRTSLTEGKLRGASALEGGLIFSAIALLFGGFAGFGVLRAMNGIRGHARPRARVALHLEAWYRRNWYVANLTCWAILAAAALLRFKDVTTFLSRPRFSLTWLAVHVFLGLLVLPVHVTLHELGHAAVGALVGFRFVETRVGWLTLRRDRGRIRLSWSRPSIPGLLGFHAAVPEETGALQARRAALAAAGPLVSLVAAGLCRVAASRLPLTSPLASIALATLTVAFWVGAAIGVMNIVPFRLASGVVSDGARVLSALRPMSAAKEAMVLFCSNWALGRRPREWGIPAAVFLRAAEGAHSDREALLLAALTVALDTGDEARVMEALARVEAAGAPREPQWRYDLELQAAMVEAFRGDGEAARDRLSHLRPHPQSPWYLSLAEAAVRLAEGRRDEAAAAIAEWEAAVARSGMEGRLRVGNEWALERLRARLSRQ